MQEQTRQQKSNKIVTIIGHKGDGKTTLTEMLMLLNRKPSIIADPRGQYPSTPKRRLLFSRPSLLAVWLADTKNYKDFYEYKLELICNCDKEQFGALSDMVSKMQNITFVVDEADMFFSAAASNEAPLNKIVQYGRHNQIDLFTTSRRPANISRNLTSLTDIFYFSRLREPNDIEYIKKAVGEKYIKIVQNLDKYVFLEIDDKLNFKIIKTKKNDINLIDNL